MSFVIKREQTVDTTTTGDILLPPNFIPSNQDVVCARGKSYWDHAGNIMYRQLIGRSTTKYSTTSNKLEKTLIVSEIVEAVHSQHGKFVKKLRKGGPWVEVDEVFAREKVGQSLRDGLHDKYKSSTKAKKQRRQNINEKFNGDIEKVIFSNTKVSNRIEQLSKEVAKNGALASDYSIITIFSRANSDILESIKKDSSMLNQYQNATVAAAAAEAQQDASPVALQPPPLSLDRSVSAPVSSSSTLTYGSVSNGSLLD